MENNIQKRSSGAAKEKTQYILTFGVIGAMLYVAQFPTLVIFFFGIFAYFLWKTFSTPSKQGIREVFEFYLAANEILRDDERRWFGFEVQSVIADGERIVRSMKGAPPLVYFALGSLYNKSGEHETAVRYLSFVVDDKDSDESRYVHPSGDLRNYVRILRKIERDPAEAPQMSAAVRALERNRKNRAVVLLEESRLKLGAAEQESQTRGLEIDSETKESNQTTGNGGAFNKKKEQRSAGSAAKDSKDSDDHGTDIHSNRKPITEVLHDIYDKNIQ